jgi:hypothetical protein
LTDQGKSIIIIAGRVRLPAVVPDFCVGHNRQDRVSS